MLDIWIDTESGMQAHRPTEEKLQEFAAAVGGAGGLFLRMIRLGFAKEKYEFFLHADDAGFHLSHHDGISERASGKAPVDLETVVRVMVGWARQNPGWDQGVDWVQRRSAPASEPVPELPAYIREQVEGHVREILRTGFVARSDVAKHAEDHVPGAVSAAQAQEIATRLWHERLAEQASWEGVTDAERIRNLFVFHFKDQGGIVARENFSCCRECGISKIRNMTSPTSRGWVFFHTQATKQVVDTGRLPLYFGSLDSYGTLDHQGGWEVVDGTDEATTAIGHEITAAIRAAGLTAEWNGSLDEAIVVKNLDWRKRLPF
ncbi:hypothetical protein SRB5_03230 [Streptomyces sp. RB5]|uniref:DUF6891 domain-containing protein n=1 Tax=Streptomyces smaragdinus TaxID=2585196 RepID=A0A7K0C9Z8_9ACTN|nr:hypothetical protein [Streptomyces smaragdinus]MQY10216.1 hypothetical protein [Streptomyces smaragdinus]